MEPRDGGTGDAPSADAADTGPTPSPFEHVGPLPGVWPYATFVAEGGYLWAVGVSSSRWSLADASGGKVDIAGDWSGSHQEAATCLVDHTVYVVAGGGDGVVSAYGEFDWIRVDLAAMTESVGATLTWDVHSPAGAVRGGQCLVIGGDPGQSPPFGSTAVRALDTTSLTWSTLAPMDAARSRHAAAVSGDALLVAGGWNGSQTLLDTASQLDLATPGATWQPAARLPHGVRDARMVVLAGRYYLVGGFDTQGEPARDLLSWASGESQWTAHGLGPEGDAIGVVASSDAIYVVAGTLGTFDLYRWRPGA